MTWSISNNIWGGDKFLSIKEIRWPLNNVWCHSILHSEHYDILFSGNFGGTNPIEKRLLILVSLGDLNEGKVCKEGGNFNYLI